VTMRWRHCNNQHHSVRSVVSLASDQFFQLCVRVFDGIVHVPLCPVQAALGFSELIATNV